MCGFIDIENNVSSEIMKYMDLKIQTYVELEILPNYESWVFGTILTQNIFWQINFVHSVLFAQILGGIDIE